MHQSLLNVPVTISQGIAGDDNNMQFLEEGRRLLAVSRFRVSEEHNGSLILFPDTKISDLRRFCEMNLQRPLDWLEVRHDFEVASMERGSPAIRLLYKLEGIPEVEDDDSAFN